MPWTPADTKKHNKKADPEKWAKTATSVRAKEMAAGKSEKEAAKDAVIIANIQAKKKK